MTPLLIVVAVVAAVFLISYLCSKLPEDTPESREQERRDAEQRTWGATMRSLNTDLVTGVRPEYQHRCDGGWCHCGNNR